MLALLTVVLGVGLYHREAPELSDLGLGLANPNPNPNLHVRHELAAKEELGRGGVDVPG